MRRIKDSVKSEDLPTRSVKLNHYYDISLDLGEFQIMGSHNIATMVGGRKELKRLGSKKKQNERLRFERVRWDFCEKL